MKRVLGIDPGFGRIGWAIVEGSSSKQSVVSFGCLETSKDDAMSIRLGEIYDHVVELVDKYKPDEAAVEELYFFKNAKTVIGVGQARGVILLALVKCKIVTADYTPLQVKSSIAGYGKADKRQVQVMLKSLLNLPSVPKPDDAADACAVALTHFFVDKRLV
jgi:crossover junction endodeoxyribonuclease RuvC